MFTRRILTVVVSATLLLSIVAGPAGAINFVAQGLTIAGEPTPLETAEITADWQWLNDSFPSTRDCLRPLTVVVVGRAEDAWGGNVSGIAAFYRVSEETVYVEHGKVTARFLIHEFAHHVDFSCGFGSSFYGTALKEVEGFSADHAWARGTRWEDVPAEHFAEAVVDYIGLDSAKIHVNPDTLDLVERFATTALAGKVHHAPSGGLASL